MLTRVGFELAPSRYRSAALPVELSSPQGLEASFIQFKCTKYSRDNLTLSMRLDVQCFNSISESSSGYYEMITEDDSEIGTVFLGFFHVFYLLVIA